jgi:hypothetical protein
MTLAQKMQIIWSLTVVLAVVLLKPWKSAVAAKPPEPAQVTRVSVLLIACALVLVGLASNTLIIHLVQIAPLVLLAVLFSWKPAWSAAAAVSLCSFWLVVMGGIWLFLVGLSRFFTGTFSTTEIVLTIVIGLASLTGLVAGPRAARYLPAAARVLTPVVAAGLQAAALWFSYHPVVTSR